MELEGVRTSPSGLTRGPRRMGTLKPSFSFKGNQLGNLVRQAEKGQNGIMPTWTKSSCQCGSILKYDLSVGRWQEAF